MVQLLTEDGKKEQHIARTIRTMIMFYKQGTSNVAEQCAALSIVGMIEEQFQLDPIMSITEEQWDTVMNNATTQQKAFVREQASRTKAGARKRKKDSSLASPTGTKRSASTSKKKAASPSRSKTPAGARSSSRKTARKSRSKGHTAKSRS